MDRRKTPMPRCLEATLATAVRQAWRDCLANGPPVGGVRLLTNEPETEALFDDGCNQIVVTVAFTRRKVGA